MDFNTNATWAKLMWAMLNFDKNDLNHKLPHSYIKTCVFPFHKQLMECWLLFKSRPPQNVEEIQNEYIFANKFVCSNNKPLKLIDFIGVHESLKELTVKCIINDNGHFLTLFIYLFGVLRRFQHCTGHITTGSWKGRGNQYIEFPRVVYCKLPTNGKQLPAFPLRAITGIEPRPQRWEVSVTTLPPWPLF